MKFWDDEKSITLTRCVVVAALIGSIAMTLGGPWVTAWFIAAAGLRPSTGLTATLLVLGYACAALAIGMLVSLYKFLRRIEKGEVFVPENVAALRRISWCCAGAAVLCLAAVFICYRPFAVLAAAAGFMALLVRVLKNVVNVHAQQLQLGGQFLLGEPALLPKLSEAFGNEIGLGVVIGLVHVLHQHDIFS